MPIIKSAIKKLRQSLARRDRNRRRKRSLKEVLDDFRKSPSLELYQKASSFLDKAAKKNTIHRNKAARLKSRLSKLVGSQAPKKAKPTKKKAK